MQMLTISDLNMLPIEVIFRGEEVYAFCKKLNLISISNNPQDACVKLQDLRKKTFEEIQKIGVALTVSKEKIDIKKYMLYSAVGMSLILPVVIITAGLLLTSKAYTIVTGIESRLRSRVSYAISNPRYISEGLNKSVIALEGITPERKNEIQYMIKRLGVVIKPFWEEIKKIDTDSEVTG